MFAFCNDVEGSPGWTFSAGTDRNPCINPEVISGDTITYELYDAGKENWYASSTHIPLEFLQISKVKDLREECGRGMFEKLKDACDQLEPVGALSVMSQFRSESYNKLLLDSGTKLFLDEAHAHPIYIHNHEEGNHTVFDLIVFTGRRWVLTDTDHIDELHDMSIQDLLDLKGVTEFFQKPKNIHTIAESEQHWVRLLSDIVPHATDSGTPIDLKWYEPEYNRELKYSFPSPRLIPEDIMFECKRCNNSTSKCRNDGVCSANGICQCVNGAFGGHCQDKPLGDSKCNVHFNKKSYDYDGGDCCGGTCDGIECGFDGLHSAFGKKLTVASFGFEHCNNPEMAVITLVWKRLRNHDYCNNGEEFCAIVALNLRCDDRTYFDLPELRLDVEDNCEGPFNQTVLVPYGSTCHLESSQDWYNVDYEFAMYYGLDESECLIHESNQDTTSVWFHIPTHCFSDALTDHMESFFDDSIQANAVETLSQDTISDRLCMNDQDLLVERFALKVLNFSVAIDNNNFKAHQCQGWGGSAVKIECDENHKITYLYIKDARTEGTIPTELALLSQLTHLDFFNDPMNGTIPVELSLLTKLEFLDFGGTELTGSIPTELFLLTNMKWLGLFEVPLSGVFPSEIGRMQKLTKLDIHKTGLIGTIHTEIGLLSKLRFLEIGDVNLTGTIPTEIGLLTNLRKLSLSHLDLRGPLPSEIGLLTTLKTLVLNAVGLTGTVPPELKNLSHLESWDLMLNEVAMSPTSDIPLNSTPTASPTNLKLTLVPTIAF
jgi:Leucine-rich repeat (LRR) protein